MKRVAAIVLLLLAAVGLAAWRFGWLERWGLIAVEPDRFALYGNIDIRQVELAFPIGGRITEMTVEEGESVQAGDALARLDQQPIHDEMRVAEAELAARQARLALLEAGARPEEIASAQAQVAEREAALANARETLSRQRRLAANGTTSPAALDDAEARVMQLEAQLAMAAEALNQLLAGPRAEEIAGARAEVAAAEARVASIGTRLEDAVLTAPDSGIILTRLREPGAIVGAGITVYALSLRQPVWVRAYVPEPDLGRIAPGMAAQVWSDSRPDNPYEGHVGFISPTAEFTPRSVETPELRSDLVYRFRVVVEDDTGGLRQGMPVTVTFPERPER
ncbi:MAG: secretion protein HlyD [Azospirillaceae bacterium]